MWPVGLVANGWGRAAPEVVDGTSLFSATRVTATRLQRGSAGPSRVPDAVPATTAWRTNMSGDAGRA